MSTCPHCNKPFAHVRINPIKAINAAGKQWNAVSYDCPLCSKSLSVMIDQVALKTDTVNEITKRLHQ